MDDDGERAGKVRTFCAVTGLTEEDAERHLEAYNWDIDVAVNHAFAEAELEDRGRETPTTEPDEPDADVAPPDGGGGDLPAWERLRRLLRDTLGALILPVVRIVVNSVTFIARLLVITPIRLLFGDGMGPTLARPRPPRDREALNAIGAAEAECFRAALETRFGPGHVPIVIGSMQQALDICKVPRIPLSGPAFPAWAAHGASATVVRPFPPSPAAARRPTSNSSSSTCTRCSRRRTPGPLPSSSSAARCSTRRSSPNCSRATTCFGWPSSPRRRGRR